MKRPFKVRIWNSFKKQMFYLEGMGTIELYDDGSGCLMDNFGEILTDISDENPLMYSLGIQDENGKDVYEGDIWVNDDDYLMQIVWNKGEVKFDSIIINGEKDSYWKDEEEEDNNAWWGYPYSGDEIIGNIYENPELLKQE